jgi:hypothetical protein
MRTICCKCLRVKVDDQWLSDYPVDHLRLSHGFCPKCYQIALKQLLERQRKVPATETASETCPG